MISRRISSFVSGALLLSSACLVTSFQSPATSQRKLASWGQSISSPISTLSPVTSVTGPAQRRCGANGGSSSTRLYFMGSDGGILGIGGPEIAVILLVGYFVLGPSDLYKLVKEIGSSIQSIRTLGTDLSTTLESNMESQLQLEDLRKAQRELTDAFSFRRSINIDDQEAEAFSTNVATPRGGQTMGDVPVAETVAGAAAGAAGAAATATGAAAPSKPTKKKKIRRRKIVREVPVPMEGDGQIPDLDMSAAFPDVPTTPSMTPEEEAIIEQEFDKYTMNEPNPMSEWYDEAKAGITPPAASTDSMETAAETQSRFQQQLSGTWNEQVLANGEPKTPLASVMELLAILEQEKNDADKRIEEEFAERAEMKEQFYQKQRRLLEDAAAQMQQADYVGADQKTE